MWMRSWWWMTAARMTRRALPKKPAHACCAALFSDLPAWLVGIRCPLEVLEERERARRDRTLGQARLQYNLVHAHGVYDVEVDTSSHTPEECAQIILQRLHAGSPRAFSMLQSGLCAG